MYLMKIKQVKLYSDYKVLKKKTTRSFNGKRRINPKWLSYGEMADYRLTDLFFSFLSPLVQS